MDEFAFIKQIKQQTYKQSSLIKGVGDDAAVFRQRSKEIVTAVDTFVDDVHFSNQTMQPFHIGYRSISATISDLAAMGAKPAFYLVSIVIPSYFSNKNLLELTQGMHRCAARYKLDLIGGDTVSGDVLTISITAIGYVSSYRVRYRHTAENQDIVFVTGTLGDSQAGLHILKQRNQKLYKDSDYFIRRHRLPEPQISFANQIHPLPRVTLNDITDGLAHEAGEIARASRVNLILDASLIPYHPSYLQFPAKLREQWTYFGGEDFELLGTVSQKCWQQLKEFASKTNTKVTKIGHVEKNMKTSGKVYLKKDRSIQKLRAKGYTHLK